MSRSFLTKVFIIMLSLYSQTSFTAMERVSLENNGMPANDLYHPNYGQLSPEEALDLNLFDQLDLSTLNPIPSEVWGPDSSNQNDQLEIHAHSTVIYRGGLTSQSGTYRFNAEILGAQNTAPFIIVLDKGLHTLLLRKNLLRQLGYRIPALKYLKNLTVEFDSLEDKQRFLQTELPQATLGAPRRWVIDGLESDELTIVLQDIAVTQPSQYDHYNVAFGVPPQVLSSRTLRALLVPYALLDIGESINKVSWNVGRINDGHLLLPHFTLAQMNTTYDDALWMARKLMALTPHDLQKIVDEAHYPVEVGQLVYQKLLSRRNSLRSLFKLESESVEFSFDAHIHFGPKLKDGVLTQEEWPGYASRFAHGPADSPFDDYGYYLLSQGQSALIGNLVSRVNRELSLFDLGQARFEYAKAEFERGLNHFVQTGEFLEQRIGTWVSPTLDGQLILSRDIVVGSYFGSDNLVQMADTFGFSARIGAHVGVEGIPYGITGSINGGISYLRTYTHLKPVRTLKESMKEPYQNMIVPFVQYMLGQKTTSLIDSLEQDDDSQENQTEELFKQFSEYLGTGESLIITERLSPNIGASANFSLMTSRYGANADVSELTIKRLHLYRRDAQTLQIYRDNGRSLSLAMSLSFDNYVPVMRLQNKNTGGKYDVKLYQISLDQDLSRNPHLKTSLKGLEQLLKDGHTELLDESNPPFEISNNFTENSNRFSFLHWRTRHLNQQDFFSIKSPQGGENQFLKNTRTQQSGINYQAFLTDIANYYLSRYLYGLSLSNDTWKNPGQTTYGLSETIQTRYEARLQGNADRPSMDQDFLSITRRKEGWQIGQRELAAEFQRINERYGQIIFPVSRASEASALKLFSLNLDLNLYQGAIQRLSRLSNEELRVVANHYRQRTSFSPQCQVRPPGGLSRNDLRRPGTTLIVDDIRCGQFSPVYQQNDLCKSLENKGRNQEWAGCLSQLAQTLEHHLDFNDFVQLVGGSQNIYLHGQITGFRQDSEILADPIEANSYGRINSRFWNGPLDAVRSMIGAQNGEFNGTWMREAL